MLALLGAHHILHVSRIRVNAQYFIALLNFCVVSSALAVSMYILPCLRVTQVTKISDRFKNEQQLCHVRLWKIFNE